MEYRKDIDGFRAVAILVVLFFHAGFTWMPGGFIGVDIFFVLSGYLITSIIVKEFNEQSFTLGNFYNRRIKRLMPAFVLVLFATTLASLHLLIPDDLILYTVSLSGAISGFSNIFFSLLSGGYFSPRTDTFPLLHTWSLSVEEQFYIFWPTVLVALLQKKIAVRNTVVMLSLLGFAFLSIHSSINYPNAAYYLPHNRAIELLIGSVVALYSRQISSYSIRFENVGSIIAAIAFCGLLYLAATLSKNDVFPGINAIVVSVLTALIIVFNKSKHGILNKLLSSRVFVSLGLISYSLYLWHWPILALLRYRLIEITTLVGTLIICASIVLASLTYIFVENPIRRSRTIHLKTSVSWFYLLPMIIIFSITAYSYATKGIPNRFQNDVQQLVQSYSAERTLNQQCTIDKSADIEKHISSLNKHCKLGDNSNTPRVLLYGDSHANHFKRFVEGLVRNANTSALYSIRGSCSSIDGLTAEGRDDQCVKRNELILSKSGNFDFVVLASAWRGEKNLSIFESNLQQAVSIIISNGSRPIIFIDNPSGNSDYSRCALHKKLSWVSATANCDIPKREVDNLHSHYDQVIRKIAAQHNEVVLVDIKALLCDDLYCSSTIEGIAVYRDSSHLNDKAASRLANQYLKTNKNPFSK